MKSLLPLLEAPGAPILRKVSYPKGHLLLQPGDTADKIWVVEEGLIREFILPDSGHEITTQIAATGMSIYAPLSYLSGAPASTVIEVIEHCRVMALRPADLSPALFRLVLEQTVMRSEKRFQILQLKRPEERLEAYERLYPELCNRLPLYYVASLLNITPQTLSRVRSLRTARLTRGKMACG